MYHCYLLGVHIIFYNRSRPFYFIFYCRSITTSIFFIHLTNYTLNIYCIYRPLGPLNYLRVWHDNSGEGKFASWYLSYIIIRDIYTKQEYYFICNKWFAVEKGDGQVSTGAISLKNYHYHLYLNKGYRAIHAQSDFWVWG